MTTTNLSSLPAQMLVEARWENHALPDVAAETTAQLTASLSGVDWTDRRVAVACGSRGIDQIATVACATVAYLRARGAQPFILPAMGSHGGGTAEGQAQMLEGLGVTEASVGAPIHAAVDTIEIGQTPGGLSVLTSRVAWEADAVMLINRIKPHTDFTSTHIGSGLRKMSIIGLGKADGAFAFHRYASRVSYETALVELSGIILHKLPQVYGVALIEDARHQLARLAVLGSAAEIIAGEPALFRQAQSWMPSLPFPEIDVLIVDEIGKNISGAGMDTNIIERNVDGTRRKNGKAQVGAIYARSLTPESHGNAIGLGFAEVVSAKLVRAMDRQSTFLNSLSAMTPAAVRTPMHFESDAECLSAALRLSGADFANPRVVRVRNTLALDRFVASASYAQELAERSDLQIVNEPQPWQFDAQGDFDAAHDLLGC